MAGNLDKKITRCVRGRGWRVVGVVGAGSCRRVA